MIVHALVKLVGVLCALLLINKYNFHFNLFLLFFILATSFFIKFSISKLIFRLKFFFILTFLLYVFNTPGEYIVVWPYFSPSYEGVVLGITQIMRLINSVTIISMMISLMNFETLIETLYLLFKPLKPFGIDAKSFAVRLYLTMEYVKSFQSKRRLKFNFNDLSSLLLNSNNKAHRKHTYIEIKEESINSSSLFLIFLMVSVTFLFIFYL
jgi:energy-coupling factor transporter transmembrane protein EcfT